MLPYPIHNGGYDQNELIFAMIGVLTQHWR